MYDLWIFFKRFKAKMEINHTGGNFGRFVGFCRFGLDGTEISLGYERFGNPEAI